PEATAGIVRAAIQHNLTYERPQRIWTHGPMFRHERPQKGRYRQFHQLDVEALGFAGPDVDAEQIVLLARLWQALGLQDSVSLKINSIGDPADRRAYREALKAYFSQHFDALDDDSKRRLSTNPLRILDSKNPEMQSLIESAPRMLEQLGAEARAHFDGLRKWLDHAGLAYEIDTRLVRGLDYYNRSVFEWITDRLGAQGTVAGGGRYDGLYESLGGKTTPACGFAAGMERLVLLMRETGQNAAPAPLAYLVHQGDAAAALAWTLAEALRGAGHDAVLHAGGGSMKSQMKKADASDACFAFILAEDEARDRAVTVKWLRKTGHEQQTMPIAALAAWLADRIK
ncbi:MAG: histidine--tRNA ligase, partial [Burkholderiales bacterium]|nr:histidine--tRNA ligase [Burkholderiales bacterium]